MMAVKEVWETILDYVQYIKVSSIHLSAIKILQKITQYVSFLYLKPKMY